MSIKSCLLLVLLLFLSFHACSARKLGPLNNKKLEEKSYASSNNKNDDYEKGFDYKISAPSKRETLPSNDDDDDDEENKATKRGDNSYSFTHEEIMKKPYPKANHNLLKDQNDDKSSCSSSREATSSVTWRVPHQRSRDKLPGFNVDYSPPTTHPPSHN